MRAVKVITDPKAFELLADETRRRMVNLLKAKELTVSQMAAELGKTPQNIYHHIRKLVDGGLVEVAREERIENFVESYYRSTADVFEVTHGQGDTDINEADIREILQSLYKVGLLHPADGQSISKAVKLVKRAQSVALGSDLVKSLEKIDDAGLVIKLHSADYAQVLLMSNKQFEEYQKLQRELRQLMSA